VNGRALRDTLSLRRIRFVALLALCNVVVRTQRRLHVLSHCRLLTRPETQRRRHLAVLKYRRAIASAAQGWGVHLGLIHAAAARLQLSSRSFLRLRWRMPLHGVGVDVAVH
jgi:hypothetical protein